VRVCATSLACPRFQPAVHRGADTHLAALDNMSSPEDWYRSLPKITRGYATTALLTTVAVQLQFISPALLWLTPPMVADFSAVTQKIELWRLVTNFCFFGPFGLAFVFGLFFLLRFGKELEMKRFEGRLADFLWALMIMGLVQIGVVYVLGFSMPFLAGGMLSSITYLWSREFADQVLSIYGLFNVQGFYFPWVMLAIRVLMGQSVVDDLIGIFAAHVYYFLEDVQGVRLAAPQLLRDFMDTPSAAAPQQRNRNMFGGHDWGRGGQRLGG